MIALKDEKNAKSQIISYLAEQGYPRYASLLTNFDINLTSDPNTVAYVENNRARIVLNKDLAIEQISVIIRHELLHRWLRHNYRLGQHVGDDKWSKRTPTQHQLGNIAADYEISNRGYTDDDKDRVRNLTIKGKMMRGLVTEDDHPEWVNLSVEEMYDKLTEINAKNDKVLKNFLNELKENGLLDLDDNNSDDNNTSSDNNSNNENNSEQSSEQPSSSEQSSEENESERRGSTIIDIEDIGRALKADKENSSRSEDNQQKEFNKAVDKAIEQVDKTLNELENNPNLSEEEKDKLKKEVLDKVKEAIDEGKQENKEQENSDSNEQNKKSINNQLRDLAKKLEKREYEKEKKLSNPDFDRSKIDKEIKLRINKIQDTFNDARALADALNETSKKDYEEKRYRKRKEAELKKKEYNSQFYDRELFLVQLDKLIRSQISRTKESTYKIPSKKRAFNSNVIFSGSHWNEKRNKPKVIVYYDRSGSWQVAWKTKAGDDAISMLNDKYVRKGLIDLEIRYFANTISSNPSEVGYGNRATQEILDDIQARKATNVIILTDDNINYGYTRPVTIPGGVFFIFVESQSPLLTEYLRGKQLNKIYFIEHQ